MSNIKVTAYLSHAIRGGKADPTIKEMRLNNAKAIIMADKLREAFPFLDIYVPAENQDYDLVTWSEKYLTTEQILEIDFKILEQKDILLVYNWCDSSGVEAERDHAEKCEIPEIVFITFSDACEKISEFFGLN